MRLKLELAKPLKPKRNAALRRARRRMLGCGLFIWFQCLGLRCLVVPLPWKPGSVFLRGIRRFGVWMPVLFIHLSMVWEFGGRFGLPDLFWSDDPTQAFASGFISALLLALAILTFLLLDWRDYRDSCYDFEEKNIRWFSLRKHQWNLWFRKVQSSDDQFNAFEKLYYRELQSYEGDADHWAANISLDCPIRTIQMIRSPFGYPLGKFEPAFQSHAYLSLLKAFTMLWIVLRMIKVGIYRLFHLGDGDRLSVLRSLATIEPESPIWMPLGFAAGIAAAMILHFTNRQALFSRSKRSDTSKRLWVVATVILACHCLLLWIPTVSNLQGFAAPALCVLGAEFIAIYGYLSWHSKPRHDLELHTEIRSPNFFKTAGFWPSAAKYAFSILTTFGVIALCLAPDFFPGHRYACDTCVSRIVAEPLELAAKSSPQTPGRIFTRTAANWPAHKPLVIVCASGGGIAAEYWTMAMLLSLERELPDFGESVRIVAGASGGLVAGAAWASSVGAANRRPADELLASCAGDQLSPVIRRLALWDLNVGIIGQRVPCNWLRHLDRGQVLERRWTNQLLPELSTTFEERLPSEVNGRTPSLIFSPMVAEDGKRLLISNLDMGKLATSPFLFNARRASGSLAYLIEDCCKLQLATCARMSATFPVISPASCLEFDDGSGLAHLVDAGYYDNTGSSIAVAWLSHYWLPWFLDAPEKCPNDVIMIEINAFPRSEFRSEPPKLGGLLFSDFQVPMMAAQNLLSVSEYRNEASLNALNLAVKTVRGRMKEQRLPSVSFFRFTNAVEASLSWDLTEIEIDAMRNWAGMITGKNGDFFDKRRKLPDGRLRKQMEIEVREMELLDNLWNQMRRVTPENSRQSS